MNPRTRLRVQPLLLLVLLLVRATPVFAQESPQNGGDFSNNLSAGKVPEGILLVKGAWASSSDSSTPVPEGSRVAANVFTSPYFELRYPLPAGWTQKYLGPPPSDSGYYVLAQIAPANRENGAAGGSILIAAQDLFFTPIPASSALELINFNRDKLSEDYQVERGPEPVAIAGRTFIRFDYGSSAAELHWHVLATEIRCHVVKFVFMGQNPKLTDALISELANLVLPATAGAVEGKGGGDVPVCIKDYASDGNLIEKSDVYFAERRFNAVPVRIIIDKEGHVKHIHFLSAFPDQARAIQDALAQWRFRPYVRDGQTFEVETGLMFGRSPRALAPAKPTANAVND